MQNKTNWLAIIAAAVAGMGLGFVVYGLLFMEQWAGFHGFTIENDKMFRDGVEVATSSTPMIVNTVVMFLYALAMNWLLNKTGETTFTGGLKIGALVGGFMFFSHYSTNHFSMDAVGLSMIDGFYSVALIALMGGIIGGWRKK